MIRDRARLSGAMGFGALAIALSIALGLATPSGDAGAYWSGLVAVGSVVLLPTTDATWRAWRVSHGDLRRRRMLGFATVASLWPLGALAVVAARSGSSLAGNLALVTGAVAAGLAIVTAGLRLNASRAHRLVRIDALDALIATFAIGGSLAHLALPWAQELGDDLATIAVVALLVLLPGATHLVISTGRAERRLGAGGMPVVLWLALSVTTLANIAAQVAMVLSDFSLPAMPLFVLCAVDLALILDANTEAAEVVELAPPTTLPETSQRVVLPFLSALLVPVLALETLSDPSATTARTVLVVLMSAGLLTLLGLRVTLASVETRSLTVRLHRLGSRDALTGALNRRAQLDELESALARARRKQRAVSVVYIDLDGLKACNDALGHEAGDALIVGFTEVASRIVGPRGTVGRMGGDEFTIVLPAFDAAAAAGLVDDLRSSSAEHHFSAGVVTVADDRRWRADDLLLAADALMYEAKRSGGDRTASSHADEAAPAAAGAPVAERRPAWPPWARRAAVSYAAVMVSLMGVVGASSGPGIDHWAALILASLTLLLPAIGLAWRTARIAAPHIAPLWRSWAIGTICFTAAGVLEVVALRRPHPVLALLIGLSALGVGHSWGAVAVGRLLQVSSARSVLVDLLDGISAATVLSGPLLFFTLPRLLDLDQLGAAFGFSLLLSVAPALTWLAWVNYEVYARTPSEDAPIGLFLAFALLTSANSALQLAHAATDFSLPTSPLFVLYGVNVAVLLVIPVYADPTAEPHVPTDPFTRRGSALPYLSAAVVPALLALEAASGADEPWRTRAVCLLLGSLLLVFALRIAVSVAEARRLTRELHDLALHDPLTGRLNRAATLDSLDRVVAQTRRTASTSSLVLIDLDGLKSVNDELGHEAGDAYITAFVEATGATIRAGDVFGRLGGDEFALLLLDADPSSATSLVERLQRSLESTTVRGRPVRFSAGVVAVQGDGPSAAAELIRRADELMYTAKRSGGGVATR